MIAGFLGAQRHCMAREKMERTLLLRPITAPPITAPAVPHVACGAQGTVTPYGTWGMGGAMIGGAVVPNELPREELQKQWLGCRAAK